MTPPKTAKRRARTTRVIEKMVCGTSITEIARDEGLSRSWVSREANSPEVRQRIAYLVDHQSERIAALFAQSLDVVAAALNAKNYKAPIRVDPGEHQVERLEYPPDHYARLAAVKRLLELATAGRPPAKAEEPKGNQTFTLEQIEEALRQNTEAEKQRLSGGFCCEVW